MTQQLQDIQINADHLSHTKKLQKKLEEQSKLKKTFPLPITSENSDVNEQLEQSDFSYSKKKKKDTLADHFKDKIILSSKTWSESHQDQTKEKELETLIEKRKYNARDIVRYMGHEINFSKRKEEFKEMLFHNIQESRASNKFVAQFSKFKVGIINQVLTFLDVSLDEINSIKKEALAELIQENQHEMEENIYHQELLEIIHGKTRKGRKKTAIFKHLELDLKLQMNRINENNDFWSFSELQNKKIQQCKKILEEFKEEKKHLEYTLATIQQQKIGKKSHERKQIIK